MSTVELIPGLPDDIALRCLARVTHGQLGVLEAVCKRWKDVIRSHEYAQLKSQFGWCGDWIFVLPEFSLNSFTPRTWIAYDPHHDVWHPLPPIPPTLGFCPSDHCGFCSLSLAGRFLVIGGTYSYPSYPLASPYPTTNLVFSFDPCHMRWSSLASMRTPRSQFASAVIDGKVYVAGGRSPTFPMGMLFGEVYDPVTNTWEELPPMYESLYDCVGLSFKGKFYVLNDQAGLSQTTIAQVFTPTTNTWSIHHQSWPFSRAMQLGIQVRWDDKLYAIADMGTSVIMKWEEEDEEWHEVGIIPPVFIPFHSYPLEAFGFGFTSLRNKLYVLGGNALRCQQPEIGCFSIEKLKVVRVCDPEVEPLEWNELHPLCLGVQGSIIGCASLEQFSD